jgi:gliding motility-associated-like protein
VCETSTAAINLFTLITGEQSGGTWTRTSGTGGVFSASAGTFTPGAGALTSTFTYTITAASPCINDPSVATVNVLAQPNAGGDGSISVCESSTAAINLFSVISGEQSGGTWVRTSGSGGTFNAASGTFTPAGGASPSTFTYTIAGVAPCVSDSSIATVNISQQPNAGTNGNVAVCESSGAVINLFDLITGEQSSGIWTRTSGTGGSFNAAAGTFTPTTGSTTSTFTYTITGIAPCITDTAVATININAQPQAGNNGQVTVCSLSTVSIDLFNLISAEQAGGTWTRTSGTGGVFNAGAGTFTPALNAVSSTFTYTLTGTAPCVNDSSIATVSITTAVLPAFAQVAPICYGDPLAALPTTSANGITGTWSAAVDNTVTTTYTFTPAALQCARPATMTIIVNPLPVVSLPQDGYICLDNNGDPSTTFELSTGLGAGYSFAWTGPGVPAGTNSSSYQATEPGSYSVVVTNTATGCVSSAQAPVITSYPPQIVKAIASDYFSEQQIVTVSVLPAGNYEYQLDGGAFQDSNQFVNVPAGDHTVHVRDKVGCGTAEDDFTIIDYPKFFTPNSDGYNDTWNIFALSNQPNSKIYIFDRYGKLVKEMSPQGIGWDGNFNGKPLPGTDYWFKVFFEEEGMQKEFKAHFSLKR